MFKNLWLISADAEKWVLPSPAAEADQSEQTRIYSRNK